MNGHFYPDLENHFISFVNYIPLVMRMRELYEETLQKRATCKKVALFMAFCHVNREYRDEESLVAAMGANEFYKDLCRKIDQSRKYFNSLITGPLKPRFSALDSFGPVQVALEPIRLFKMATVPDSPELSEQDTRTREEAQRAFVFALQLLSWDAVESEADVAENLSQIEEIALRKMFTGKFVKLWIVIETNPANSSRALGQPLFFETKAEAHRAALNLRQSIKEAAEAQDAEWLTTLGAVPEEKKKAHEMRLSGLTVHEEKELWELRTVEIDDEIWEIRHVSRDKSLERAVEKKERYCVQGKPKKAVADRGGWMYIVVSVVSRTGVRRAATKADAEFFSEYTHKRIWTGPLEQMPDLDDLNKNSHRDYWDIKTIGRFTRQIEYDNRFVASRVEQIVTTGREYLSTQTSTGGDRHYVYQAAQLFDYLCPLWWPRLSWDSKERHSLMLTWKTQ